MVWSQEGEMNVMIGNEMIHCHLEEIDISEDVTLGDRVAVAVVGLFTGASLSIGIWSGIILFNGNIHMGGPLRYVVKILQILGII